MSERPHAATPANEHDSRVIDNILHGDETRVWAVRLDQQIIATIEEAQDFARQWLRAYNNDRPNMGIGGITPAQKLKSAA